MHDFLILLSITQQTLSCVWFRVLQVPLVKLDDKYFKLVDLNELILLAITLQLL
jgi:hypothetical protein